jgi:copper chaperone
LTKGALQSEMAQRRHQMTRLSVPEMSCGHCKATIEAALAGIGAGAVQVDLASRQLTADADAAAMIAALGKVGFGASELGPRRPIP